MKNTFRPLILSIALLTCFSCSGGGTSKKTGLSSDPRNVGASAFVKVAEGLDPHYYTAALLTANCINEQDGQSVVDEQGSTCSYVLDSSRQWAIQNNALGEATAQFSNLINAVYASRAPEVLQSLSEQASLSSPRMYYFLEGGMSARLNGKFPASLLDKGVSGEFDFTITLSFNEFGLLTRYEMWNEGNFTYSGHGYRYSDHTWLTYEYAGDSRSEESSSIESSESSKSSSSSSATDEIVEESAFDRAILELTTHPYQNAEMDCYCLITHNGLSNVKEEEKYASYVWGDRSFEITESDLGPQTQSFAEAPNEYAVFDYKESTHLHEDLYEEGTLSYVLTFLADGGYSLTLEADILAEKELKGATGTLHVTLSYLWDEYGLVTEYESLKEGDIVYGGYDILYKDHRGFTVKYGVNNG